MRLTVPQFNSDLNFQPSAEAERWTPTFAWGSQLLNNFKSAPQNVIDLKSTAPDFYSAFAFCYPKLNLLELFRLSQCFVVLNAKDIAISSEEFVAGLLKVYGYNVRDEHYKILALLKLLPTDFLNWIEEKEVWFNDLSILLELSSPQEIFMALNWIVSSRCSKSQGIQVLELVCELHLRGEDYGFMTSFFGSIENPNLTSTKDRVIDSLRALRFKRTTSSDAKRSERLKKINWPSGVTTQFARNGDRSSIQIQLNLQSKKDLETQLLALNERTNSLKEIL